MFSCLENLLNTTLNVLKHVRILENQLEYFQHIFPYLLNLFNAM